MDKKNRKRIGIIFNFRGSWLGGVYYVLNLIKTLDTLEDVEKPEILIFCKPDLKKYTKEIEYPFLKVMEWDFPSFFKGYLKSWFFRKNFFTDKIIKEFNLDGVYPLYEHPISNKKNKNVSLIAWFPDLQHKFYPHYFTKLNIIMREIRLKMMLNNSDKLVVSSNDVKEHFEKFYGASYSSKIEVLQFVSVIDSFKLDNFDNLRVKYSLPESFFMVSNQFYEHKNHIVVLKALKEILKRHKDVYIVMTGKMEDYRNPKYIKDLKSEISDETSKNLFFLGVLPRDEQLCIMKNSLAVIQPSLFEGWSTVIEDAKSLNVPVISSDILVHKEQLEENGLFFEAKNPDSLKNAIEIFLSKENRDISYEDYEVRKLKCAKKFISIFD